jgi:hypothetical protein
MTNLYDLFPNPISIGSHLVVFIKPESAAEAKIPKVTSHPKIEEVCP